jgi:hypothetical protein
MRILHVTGNIDWWPYHFEQLCQRLGHTGETFHLYGEAGMRHLELTTAAANDVWNRNKDYFNSFDAVFVSHLANGAQIFLQNNWPKPLYIWFYFRFDHCAPEPARYYALLREAANKPNVKMFAATEQDRIYVQTRLGQIPLDIVPPLSVVDSSIKAAIPCGTDKFFLGGKHNDTMQKGNLEALGIPLYHHPWGAQPDCRGVRGILHFPYVNMTKTMSENLAIENVYFLPDDALFNHFRRTVPTYFWDGHVEITELDFRRTAWYNDVGRKLFVYYSSFEELKRLSDSPDFVSMLAEKKAAIREHNQTCGTLEKWERIFSL